MTQPTGRFESIGPPPITWGTTLCYQRHCTELAVLSIDGWPYCLDCGDDLVEREVAVSIKPDFADIAPSLGDR